MNLKCNAIFNNNIIGFQIIHAAIKFNENCIEKLIDEFFK
jgi:hypothetical protein